MSNDPYSRPINATRPTAQRVGEFYGQISTHSQRSAAAGNPNAAPAIGSTQPYEPRSSSAALPVFPRKDLVATDVTPESTTPNADATSPSDDELPVMAEPVITEDDLFG